MRNSTEKSGTGVASAAIHRRYAIFKQPKKNLTIMFRIAKKAASQGFVVLKGITSRKST
jgi:hypothetical protein